MKVYAIGVPYVLRSKRNIVSQVFGI